MSRKNITRKQKQRTEIGSSNIAVDAPSLAQTDEGKRPVPQIITYEDFCRMQDALVSASELHRMQQAVKKIEAATPKYAALPPSLFALAENRLFLAARSYGRMNFHDDLYVYDEATDALVYRPEPFTSEQVCEMVTCALLGINGDYKDLLFVLAFPLSMRAGLVHGYLSALQVSQPREAEVGLVALEYFVAPRLAQGLIDVPLAFADVPLAGADMLPVMITFENKGNRPRSRSRSRSKTS